MLITLGEIVLLELLVVLAFVFFLHALAFLGLLISVHNTHLIHYFVRNVGVCSVLFLEFFFEKLRHTLWADTDTVRFLVRGHGVLKRLLFKGWVVRVWLADGLLHLVGGAVGIRQIINGRGAANLSGEVLELFH